MIALDTNVVLRFLTQHDPAQSAQAIALLAGLTERDRGFLCREVVVELVRVLERAYGLPRHDIPSASTDCWRRASWLSRLLIEPAWLASATAGAEPGSRIT